ncbi:MAG: type II toxin-antitoxin system RelB/DinJ family antitoxin [Eggerthellaceae bacterium]|nr:type II toxin-antitoxin system RelB/DinJ family antitoxin [Eggerthellaceae bacterium]
MAGTATLNVRMDSDTKRDFTAFCDELGMSASSLMNVFAKTVVRNQEVPFAMTTRVHGHEAERYRRIFPRSEAELLDMLEDAAAVPLDSCVSQRQGMQDFEERMGW